MTLNKRSCDSLCYYREELQERYEGKIAQNMSGTFYEVFSRVMRVLVGRKITVPGTFKRCVTKFELIDTCQDCMNLVV